MTQDEATRLVAKLFAAYDKPREKLTAAVYIEAFVKADYALGLRAVDELIASEKWLPTVAHFTETYSRIRHSVIQSRSAMALGEGQLSEEERAENLRRLRELTARLARGLTA